LWQRAVDAIHRNRIAAMAHQKYSHLLGGLVRWRARSPTTP
jgi:hypothetical protein